MKEERPLPIPLNFFVVQQFLQHREQAPMLHTQGGFSWATVDEDRDSDPDVADSWSNLSEQVYGWQDGVETTVFTLFDAEKTVVTPQVFLSSSHWLLKDWMNDTDWQSSTVLPVRVMCAKLGGSTLIPLPTSSHGLTTATLIEWWSLI